MEIHESISYNVLTSKAIPHPFEQLPLKKRFYQKSFFHYALLISSCIIVFYPIFTHEFQLRWDDQWVVFNHYTEGGINVQNLTAIFTEYLHGQYAPINELFYLLLYTAFGYDAFWFHTASLTIHILNVLLLFTFMQKLLKQSSRIAPSSIIGISFLTSLLMAIHPLQVEAVSWMAASKCILYALFYLIALHFYLDYRAGKGFYRYLLTILFFIISFCSKEQAITLPICLLLIDYILKKDLSSSKIWFEKLPFFCLAASFSIITFYSQAFNGEGILSALPQYPIYQNVVFAAYSVTEYFIKSVLPIRLSYIYPFPNLPGESLPTYLWIYPVMLLFVTIGFLKFWSKPLVFFGIAFFLIHVSIISNLIPTYGSTR